MKLERVLIGAISALLLISSTSCKLFKKHEEVSNTTGWAYGDEETGSVPYKRIKGMAAGPGLIFIPGGTFLMGRTQEDVMSEWNNSPRRVTISSFYMDECEIRNIDWLEYLNWLSKYISFPEAAREALPDTLVWREALAYNEPMVKNYLRFPPFAEYPVVGVTWEQAQKYCKWRTNRVNEKILVDNKFLPKSNPESCKDDQTFDTDAYLAGVYKGQTTGDELAKWESGIMLPEYRLPTEAEWEYAAYGITSGYDENIPEARIYPWDGIWVRNGEKRDQGRMMANFARGRGDYMGIAGDANDGYSYTAPTKSFLPNEFGLYDMAGNVSEWVADVYRPLSFEDVAEFNPYRGNVFTTIAKDSAGNVQTDSLGQVIYRNETDEELKNRTNYRTADNRNYDDGDTRSSLEDLNGNKVNMYKPSNEIISLINDEARVYKGGSWKDRAYWLTPGARRFKNQKDATNDIGFRCAMSHIGADEQ